MSGPEALRTIQRTVGGDHVVFRLMLYNKSIFEEWVSFVMDYKEEMGQAGYVSSLLMPSRRMAEVAFRQTLERQRRGQCLGIVAYCDEQGQIPGTVAGAMEARQLRLVQTNGYAEVAAIVLRPYRHVGLLAEMAEVFGQQLSQRIPGIHTLLAVIDQRNARAVEVARQWGFAPAMAEQIAAIHLTPVERRHCMILAKRLAQP
jgi:hypothetical protein